MAVSPKESSPYSNPDQVCCEQTRTPVPIKELIIDAYKSKSKSLQGVVETVELASLAPEAEELIRHSLLSRTMKEFGRAIYIADGKKIVIDNKPQVGGEAGMTLMVSSLPGKRLFGISRKNGERYFVGAMHSHPVDLPFSPLDLVTLLAKEEPYRALMGMVATPKRTMVCFRGADTPQLEIDDVFDKSKSWSKALNDRIEMHTASNPSSAQVLDISNRVQMSMLRDISLKYDLKVYSAERGASVLSRVKFQKP